jgi:hypothetical protein
MRRVLMMSEWLLFNTDSTIYQIYHGEHKLIFNEMMMRANVVDAELDCYSAISLKQQSEDRYIVQLWHIILIPGHPVFALSS